MKKSILSFLGLYKKFISPGLKQAFGSGCRFYPDCSSYMSEAIEKYGIFKGSILGIRRLLRCNPFGKAGYDPIP